MQTTYTLQAEEFPQFAESIKSLFQGKTFRVTLSDNISEPSIHAAHTDIEDSEEENAPDLADLLGLDETEYLMRSPANHAHLMKAIEDVNARRNLITVPLEDVENIEKLKEYARKAREERERQA